MKLRSRRIILMAAGLAAMTLLTAGLIGSQVNQTAQQPKPQMSEEVFKNIQVLRGIPVDEFMDTMGMFAAALSLNCIDCHTAESVDTWDHFADETPLKQRSRQMVNMVNAINKQNFSGVRSVTCYTCHRGDLRPKIVPNLAAQYAEHMEDPNEIEVFRVAGGPTADQVFDRYTRALGGAQRLAALTSYTGRGTFVGFETEQNTVPVEIYAKAPNQRTTVVHVNLGESVRTFDGRAGWIASPDRPVPLMPLTGGNLEGSRLDAILSFPGQLKQAFSQWRVGATAIDEKEVTVLQGTNPRVPPVNFYFEESGLLVRVVRFVDTAVGRVPTQIDYSDYRDVAGVKMPFKWTTTWTNGQATTQLTEMRPNVAIDAARLSRPAPAVQKK
jgi:photosynthetic reaction center cytochrome c subunit